MSHGGAGAGQANDPTLVRVGGALGIAACIIGLAIFVGACAGMGAALSLSPLPVIMGGVGFVLSIVGSLCKHSAHPDLTHELAAVAVSLWGLLGGLVLMAAWRGWDVFYK